MKKIDKKGFTLIELLSTIVILGLILGFCYFSVSYLLRNAYNSIDKATKRMIIDAASDYAIEYRSNENWKEEIKEDNRISYCISLKSLVDYGYFKENTEKILEKNSTHIVKASIVNGVSKYELVKLVDLEEDDQCKYYNTDSSISKNDHMETIIEENGKDIGTLKYNISKDKNDEYTISLNLDIDIKDEILSKKELYVSLILDRSNSMWDPKGSTAINTAINFSSLLYKNVSGSKVALIQYDAQPILNRKFSHDKLQKKDFLPIDNVLYNDTNISDIDLENSGGTNVPGGIDLATSLIYNEEDIKKNPDAKVYAILLYDGISNTYSRYIQLPKTNGQKAIFGDANTYPYVYPAIIANITDLKKKEKFKSIYKENFINWSNPKEYKINNVWGGSELMLNTLNASVDFLKEMNVKLISIGYYVEKDLDDEAYNEKFKAVASIDNELCKNSDYSVNGNNYCHFDASSKEEIEKVFDNILDKLVVQNSSVQKVTYTLTPKEKNNQPVITIFENGVKVNNNKITKSIDISSINQSGNLVFDDKYSFKLNENVYENCDQEQCSTTGKVLFDIKLKLIYPDREEEKEIVSTEFNLEVNNIDTIN